MRVHQQRSAARRNAQNMLQQVLYVARPFAGEVGTAHFQQQTGAAMMLHMQNAPQINGSIELLSSRLTSFCTGLSYQIPGGCRVLMDEQQMVAQEQPATQLLFCRVLW